jgi:hypothetical protein
MRNIFTTSSVSRETGKQQPWLKPESLKPSLKSEAGAAANQEGCPTPRLQPWDRMDPVQAIMQSRHHSSSTPTTTTPSSSLLPPPPFCWLPAAWCGH